MAAVVGRNRGVVTDTIGLVLAVLVTAASVQDSITGTQFLDQVAAEHPGIRRLARDYETHPHRSEATIHIAMTDLVARRLTSENTTSWRDPTPQTKQQIPG